MVERESFSACGLRIEYVVLWDSVLVDLLTLMRKLIPFQVFQPFSTIILIFRSTPSLVRSYKVAFFANLGVLVLGFALFLCLGFAGLYWLGDPMLFFVVIGIVCVIGISVCVFLGLQGRNRGALISAMVCNGLCLLTAVVIFVGTLITNNTALHYCQDHPEHEKECNRLNGARVGFVTALCILSVIFFGVAALAMYGTASVSSNDSFFIQHNQTYDPNNLQQGPMDGVAYVAQPIPAVAPQPMYAPQPNMRGDGYAQVSAGDDEEDLERRKPLIYAPQ